MEYTYQRSPYSMGNRCLSANALKLIAALCMVVDHVGAYLLPELLILRLVGRLSLPIFAYFIAEGCRYTRNKCKRFLLIFGLAVLCEVVYFLYSGVPEGTILLTFSCSILLIYALQAFKRALAQRRAGHALLLGGLFLLAVVGVYAFNRYVVSLSYGMRGVLLPLFVSVLDYREGEAPAFLKRMDLPSIRLAFYAVGLVFLTLFSLSPGLQAFGMLALIPLALYNGKPGSGKCKYWFYVFYPAHLVLIWLIGFWVL